MAEKVEKITIKAVAPHLQQIYKRTLSGTIDLRNGREATLIKSEAERMIMEGRGGIVDVNNIVPKEKPKEKSEGADVTNEEISEERKVLIDALPESYQAVKALAIKNGYNGENTYSREACVDFLVPKDDAE